MLKRDPNAKQPKYIAMDRRQFLVKVVPTVAGATLLAACAPSSAQVEPRATVPAGTTMPAGTAAPAGTAVPPMTTGSLPAALAHADPYASTNHAGFRCASDRPPANDTPSHLAVLPGETRQ